MRAHSNLEQMSCAHASRSAVRSGHQDRADRGFVRASSADAGLASVQTAITREHPPPPAPHDAAEAAAPGAVTQAPASPQPIAPTPLPPASVRAAVAESMAAPPTSPPSALLRCLILRHDAALVDLCCTKLF